MIKVARLVVPALVLVVPMMRVSAQATGGQVAERSAVAYSADGALYLATETGRVLQKIEPELPIGDFAISPDLKTIVPGECR